MLHLLTKRAVPTENDTSIARAVLSGLILLVKNGCVQAKNLEISLVLNVDGKRARKESCYDL